MASLTSSPVAFSTFKYFPASPVLTVLKIITPQRQLSKMLHFCASSFRDNYRTAFARNLNINVLLAKIHRPLQESGAGFWKILRLQRYLLHQSHAQLFCLFFFLKLSFGSDFFSGKLVPALSVRGDLGPQSLRSAKEG